MGYSLTKCWHGAQTAAQQLGVHVEHLPLLVQTVYIEEVDENKDKENRSNDA